MWILTKSPGHFRPQRKGKLLSVSGNIQTRNYEAKDGTKRYVTEVLADEVDFLEWGGNKESGTNTNQGGNSSESKSGSHDFGSDSDITPIDDGDIPF